MLYSNRIFCTFNFNPCIPPMHCIHHHTINVNNLIFIISYYYFLYNYDYDFVPSLISTL